MTDIILEIDGLGVRLGGMDILNGVSARLRAGGITAFIGPNGAGKTTLFHAITGEIKPDAGQVRFQGMDITGREPWEVARLGIGKMFQDVRVFPGLSVRDNVVAALQRPSDRSLRSSLRYGDRRWRNAEKAADTLLDRVGVEGRREGLAGELSWGNQKLLAFARLLAGKYRFVLLDEPVAGVSPTLRERIRALLRDWSATDGVTIALIEHDMAFVRDLAHDVVVLKEGRVFDAGASNDVLGRDETVELCLGL